MRNRLETTLKCVEVIGGDADYTKERYGFGREDKGFRTSYGCKNVSVNYCPANVERAYYLPGMNSALVVRSNTYMDEFKYSSGNRFDNAGHYGNMSPPVPVYAFNGTTYTDESAYAFFSDGDLGFMRFASGNRIAFNMNMPAKYSIMHCGRIFCIDKSDNCLIRWSARSFNEWTPSIEGGGSIRIDCDLGGAEWLAEYGNDIVVFCSEGIKVMHALSDARLFGMSATGNFNLGERLKYDSSALCGGKLWFGTETGLFWFDGTTVKRVCPDCIDGVYSPVRITPCTQDRFIAEVIKGSDRYLLEYETDTGRSALFGRGLKCVMHTDSATYTFRSSSLVMLDKSLYESSYYWQSEDFDFGTDTIKYLKSVELKFEGRMTVRIKSENGMLNVSDPGVTKTLLNGRSFSFRVTGCGKIISLKAVAEVKR